MLDFLLKLTFFNILIQYFMLIMIENEDKKS